MTYLIAPLDKILRLFVRPLLPWSLFGQMNQLLLPLAVWRRVWIAVPSECVSNVPVKA